MEQHGGDVYTYKGVIDFSSNINPLGMPENVKREAMRGVEMSFQYPDIYKRELLEGLACKEGVLLSQLFCGNGAAEVLFSLALGLRPRRALLLAPTFAEYEQSLRAVNCEVLYYRLLPENGFQLMDDYYEQLTDDLDIVYLCNPNNPTGCLIERKKLLKIADICQAKNIYMVVDECFNAFLDFPDAFSMKGYLNDYDKLFIVKAFTKIYGMPGLRLGYGLSMDEELLLNMQEVTQPWNVSLPAQLAGVAALGETDFIEKTRKLILEERAYLKESLIALGYEIFDSKGNYLFFKGPEDLFHYCLSRGLLIRDCSNYENLEKGYYRIAVRSHEDNLTLITVLKERL